jgi:hypothetical protein
MRNKLNNIQMILVLKWLFLGFLFVLLLVNGCSSSNTLTETTLGKNALSIPVGISVPGQYTPDQENFISVADKIFNKLKEVVPSEFELVRVTGQSEANQVNPYRSLAVDYREVPSEGIYNLDSNGNCVLSKSDSGKYYGITATLYISGSSISYLGTNNPEIKVTGTTSESVMIKRGQNVEQQLRLDALAASFNKMNWETLANLQPFDNTNTVEDQYKISDTEAKYRSQNKLQFTDEFSQYIKQRSSLSLPEIGGQPYVRKNIVFVYYIKEEMTLQEINQFFYEKGFPIATRTEDVGALILVKYFKTKVGEYGPSGSVVGSIDAIRNDCSITVIDNLTSQVIIRNTLQGMQPPEETWRDYNFPGPTYSDIFDYVKTLPLISMQSP